MKECTEEGRHLKGVYFTAYGDVIKVLGNVKRTYFELDNRKCHSQIWRNTERLMV
jgi:hypothetical protein